MLGILTLHLHIPGCKSLKEKRSQLKPLLSRLHKEFNISVAEMDAHDVWQSTVIACAVVGNDKAKSAHATKGQRVGGVALAGCDGC